MKKLLITSILATLFCGNAFSNTIQGNWHLTKIIKNTSGHYSQPRCANIVDVRFLDQTSKPEIKMSLRYPSSSYVTTALFKRNPDRTSVLGQKPRITVRLGKKRASKIYVHRRSGSGHFYELKINRDGSLSLKDSRQSSGRGGQEGNFCHAIYSRR